MFEDGEGGLEANGWRSFGVGEDLLDVGECEACEHRDLRAELFLEFGVGRFDGFEEAGIFGPVVEGGAVDIEFRGDGGTLESEAWGDGRGGLDGSQISAEVGRFRGGGGLSKYISIS